MSETRIVLLYSTNIEGSNIMKWASEAGLTGRSYVWIATQSVIGESVEGSPELPAGMLGEWLLFFSISTTVRSMPALVFWLHAYCFSRKQYFQTYHIANSWYERVIRQKNVNYSFHTRMYWSPPLLMAYFSKTGVSFDTSLSNLISQISNAMMVFVHGAESFIEDPKNSPESLVPNLSCDSARDQAESQETRWTLGETFHK